MKSNEELIGLASKRYGQNFLKNHSYIQKIIQAMPKDNLPIVEIGPGLGDLTKELVRARDVTAFEVDKRLCEHLIHEFELPIREGRLTLKCADAIEHWEQKGLLDEHYHLVANLPYYIATNLILRALHDPYCQSILTMVQKEVAIKFSAKPTERNFSALGVLADSVGEGKICFEVEPEAFVPPPKVTSAVLSIVKFSSLDDLGFEDFLKVAFSQPRKKLSKNLNLRYQKDRIIKIFADLELEDNIRPHEAATSIYHQIYNALKQKDNEDERKSRK
ncbi:MAG: 16S rRNA (adenine(1518)-N(6)/adenine(1519)-N(6))-dimethyltransferase RsmA [Sulfurovum sp.]|nr:16S rRNA (adenine(1518)-N(6)/adenine(1519)-N(6))-dimethyltransferase RsmA [Sulfurovum sp.]